MDYVPRAQEGILSDFLSRPGPDRPVLLVEGARQVGKTTLVSKHLSTVSMPVTTLNLERQKIVRARIDSCEEFDDLSVVLRDECGFDTSNDGVLFIDEAQESEQLGGFVRFMKEEWPHTRTILSGSTLTRLFRPTHRFPVGRITRLLVTPFAFSEFLVAAQKSFLADRLNALEQVSATEHESLCRELDRYLLTGGLPAAVAAAVGGGDAATVRREIVADYDDDLKRVFGENTMAVVRACLRATAQLAASPFKNTAIIPSPSTAQNEVINHVLSRLEDWHFVLKSEQLGIDPLQSYRYHPKRYLFDTGVMRDMRELAVPSLKLLERSSPAVRTSLGAVIENQAAVDLSREGGKLAGWKKSSSGTEIDFVLKVGERSVPVECKAALEIKGKHLEGVTNYLRQYGQPTGIIVSLARYQQIDCGNGMTVLNVPLYATEKVRKVIAAMGPTP
jgi:predicted AAA+ superfamily ATPase